MRQRTAGFTLVELMIVVAILGLLAAVAIPQFAGHKEEGRTAAMVSSLSVLRTAVDSYWTQHDAFPGQDGAAQFADQLLCKTSKQGDVGTGSAFTYGPYLRNGQIPTNPLTSTSTVKVVDTMPSAPSGPEGWIYSNVTGEMRCNAAGNGVDGVKYFSY
jgi:prepilin-type N-terminal cleavage/methylation domain-containing protein